MSTGLLFWRPRRRSRTWLPQNQSEPDLETVSKIGRFGSSVGIIGVESYDRRSILHSVGHRKLLAVMSRVWEGVAEIVLKALIWIAGGVVAVAFVGGILAVTVWRPDTLRSFSAADLGTFTADEASDQSFRIAPEMLAVVYRAFGETDEAAIYDSLAEVAAGDALDALYLERLGAMVGGGLDQSAQSDQQIHSMELIRLNGLRTGTTLQWDARWRVVGTVGHATHLHVRGNTYAATLTVEPVDGSWRMTAFDLTDVDRSEAGTMVAANP